MNTIETNLDTVGLLVNQENVALFQLLEKLEPEKLIQGTYTHQILIDQFSTVLENLYKATTIDATKKFAGNLFRIETVKDIETKEAIPGRSDSELFARVANAIVSQTGVELDEEHRAKIKKSMDSLVHKAAADPVSCCLIILTLTRLFTLTLRDVLYKTTKKLVAEPDSFMYFAKNNNIEEATKNVIHILRLELQQLQEIDTVKITTVIAETATVVKLSYSLPKVRTVTA